MLAGQGAPPQWSDAKQPRIALVGCGAIAKDYYLPALSKYPRVMAKLILVDRELARVQALAAEFKVSAVFTDFQEVLGQVDAVIIATPTHLHHPIAKEFLCRGIHVLCEKPLAESGANARDLVEQSQKTGAILAVNYLQRLYASFAKVKQLLSDQALGRPLSIRYVVGEEFKWPTVSGFYFNSPLASRGVLRDRGAHVLDHICWWLGGKPSLVSSQNDSFGGSEAVAHVRFERDLCTGYVKLSWLNTLPSQFEVECEGGTIQGAVYDYQNLTLQIRTGKRKRIRSMPGGKSKQEVASLIVSNFIQAATTGKKPLVSGYDVLESVEFVDECYAAATRFDMPWYEVSAIGSRMTGEWGRA